MHILPERNILTGSGRPWHLLYPDIERTARVAVANTRRNKCVSDRDLLRHLLLHLPRFSTHQILKDPDIVPSECARLAAHIESTRIHYRSWQNCPVVDRLAKDDLVLRPCHPQIAQVIHETFHYIGSYHAGLVHLGLFRRGEDGVPMALASLAPMDIRRLEGLFESTYQKKHFLVISRVFAFDWAPRNTISYLLGQVTRWIKRNLSEVKSFLTFLNPNLGFSGAAFRASNWKPFLELEPASTYISGNYIPFRAVMEMQEIVRRKVTYSRHNLTPLKLLRYDLAPIG
jgi:hypothetical protein